MATSAEQLTALYQQYFGRAPDEAGFNFWLNSGYTPEQIAAEFQKSPEYEAVQARPYATGTPATEAQINALYKAQFGRDADPEGLAFYKASGGSPEQIQAQLAKSPETSGIAARQYATGTAATQDEIRQLYKDVLGRDVDKEGLQFYDASDWSADQIRKQLMGSTEKVGDTKKDVKTGTDVKAKTTEIDPSQSTLSPNFADYVYKMLAMGEEAASRPYEAFTGERFAGPSDLQTQAFQGLAGLKVPGQYGEASAELKKALQGVGSLAYDPTKFTDPYKAPETYTPTDITTQQWGAEAAFKYMNPFLRAALEPQLQDLSRRAQIEKLADAAKYSAAGAYGGSRGALAEAEANRNLLSKQSDVLSSGYKTAYDVGQQAFMTDQQRALAAQQAAEQSKQFGYGQQMNAAQLAAQYGLDTQRAQEAANQFGATYGLQGLQTGITGAKTLADIGTQEQAAGLANLSAQLTGGATQQALAQQPLDFGYQQWQESMKYPYQQATYMQSLLQGLPLQAQPYSDGTSGLASALQGGLLGLSLANTLSK